MLVLAWTIFCFILQVLNLHNDEQTQLLGTAIQNADEKCSIPLRL